MRWLAYITVALLLCSCASRKHIERSVEQTATYNDSSMMASQFVLDSVWRDSSTIVQTVVEFYEPNEPSDTTQASDKETPSPSAQAPETASASDPPPAPRQSHTPALTFHADSGGTASKTAGGLPQAVPANWFPSWPSATLPNVCGVTIRHC